MSLSTIEYTDTEGRRSLRGLPAGVPASKAAQGVPLGPPSLAELGLPKEIEVRLHNQLFARGLFTEQDARAKPGEIHSAIVAALRLDVQRILAVYQGSGAVNGT